GDGGIGLLDEDDLRGDIGGGNGDGKGAGESFGDVRVGRGGGGEKLVDAFEGDRDIVEGGDAVDRGDGCGAAEDDAVGIDDGECHVGVVGGGGLAVGFADGDDDRFCGRGE